MCFALDTIGSMCGPIEAAKRKTLTIDNAFVQAPTKPRLRFCLLAYRERGNGFYTRDTPLIGNLDALHAALMEL